MLRSRVISGIDTERLASAVSRPGIDPRIWVSYAVLLDDPVLNTDKDGQDVFANIMLLPSGTVETARVGTIYAGNGFGFYAPLYKDDEVLVVAPSGDPDEGLVITQRFWSPADPPPEGLNIEELTLVLQEGKNLRIKAQGGGNVYLTVDTGKVYLGSPDGTEPVALGTQVQQYLDRLQPFFTGFNTWVPAPTDGGAALQVAVKNAYLTAGTTMPTSVPNVEATTTEVK